MGKITGVSASPGRVALSNKARPRAATEAPLLLLVFRNMLYVLCGYCFAGKSTLARALEATYGFCALGVDEILFERGYASSTRRPTGTEWDECFAEHFRCLEAFVVAGRNVVEDGCNESRGDRDFIRSIAHRHGVGSTIVWLDVAPDVVRARSAANLADPTRHVVLPEAFERHITDFQPPTDETPLIRWTQDSPLKDFLETQFGRPLREGSPLRQAK